MMLEYSNTVYALRVSTSAFIMMLEYSNTVYVLGQTPISKFSIEASVGWSSPPSTIRELTQANSPGGGESLGTFKLSKKRNGSESSAMVNPAGKYKHKSFRSNNS